MWLLSNISNPTHTRTEQNLTCWTRGVFYEQISVLIRKNYEIKWFLGPQQCFADLLFVAKNYFGLYIIFLWACQSDVKQIHVMVARFDKAQNWWIKKSTTDIWSSKMKSHVIDECHGWMLRVRLQVMILKALITLKKHWELNRLHQNLYWKSTTDAELNKTKMNQMQRDDR